MLIKLKNSRCHASSLHCLASTFNRIVMQIFLKTAIFSMLTRCKTNCLVNTRRQTSAKQGKYVNTLQEFKKKRMKAGPRIPLLAKSHEQMRSYGKALHTSRQ